MKIVKEIFLPTLALVIICTVAAALLGTVNFITKDIIAANENLVMEKSRKELLPQAASFESISPGGTENECYAVLDANNSLAGYIFICSSRGYSGEISVMTALALDGTVEGVKILVINETPALGMKADSEAFLSQYKGKQGRINYSGENSVDVISGATISTNAVTNAVNEAIDLYSKIAEVD